MRWRAAVERLLHPGYACCRLCRRPLKCVVEHVVYWGAGHPSTFVICENCWTDLATSEARLSSCWPLYQRILSGVPKSAARQMRTDWNSIVWAIVEEERQTGQRHPMETSDAFDHWLQP